MLCKFFESFEDIYRSSSKNDDSCELNISDSEEEPSRFPKKLASVKKIANADLLPKTSPCDYNFAVKEWNFYKTETASLLESSHKLKKIKAEEKRRSFKNILDASANLEAISKKENLHEDQMPSNSIHSPKDELCIHEPDIGKSMLLEIQNVNSFPQSLNIHEKKYLPIQKPLKFSADCDLLNGVKVTPRLKKIKPQLLLKDASLGVFANNITSFKVPHEKSRAVAKNVDTSAMPSLLSPKVKKITLHQTADSKRNASDVACEGFVESENMFSKISKESNSFIDCSFHGDLRVTSKVKKVKVEDVRCDEKKVVSDVSMSFEQPADQSPEILETTDSPIKGSGSQSAMKEDYNISDCSGYSDHLVPNSMSQRIFMNIKTSNEKHSNRENFENINECAGGNKDLQKAILPQNVASSIPRGSDFVKNIKFHQDAVPKPKSELEVHSERRKKYLPGGFAEQAQKLEHREKSSVVLWNYQTDKERGIGSSQYLSLKVLSSTVTDSFVITKCEILEDSSISVEQNDGKRGSVLSYVFRRNATNKESVDDKKYVYCNVSGRRERFKTCLLVVKLETWEKLKLTTSSLLRIFPPWQTLWIDKLNIHALLCTYFMEVLSIPPPVEESPMEKVLYSRVDPNSNDYTQDAEKIFEVSQSPSVCGYKKHSSSGFLLKLNEKRKSGKSFLSSSKTRFPRKITKDIKVGEHVVVTGKIIKIHEENSVMWLECDQCQSGNLVEDEQGITYCEDCNVTVEQPVRKMKMEVILRAPDVPDIMLVVQLFHPTLQKILPLANEGQPLCRASDILQTSVGPVVCSVISCSKIGHRVTYHLQEIS